MGFDIPIDFDSRLERRRPATWLHAVPPLPTVEVSLRDGEPVALRPQRREDRPLVAAFFDSLSPRSRYLRFLSPVRRLSPALLERLCAVDGQDHFAWLALHEGEIAGLGRWVRTTGGASAEVALSVRDDLQGRGLGRLLLEALALVAPTRGVTCFELVTLSENRRALSLLRSAGARFRFRHGQVSGLLAADAVAGERLPRAELLALAGAGDGGPRRAAAC